MHSYFHHGLHDRLHRFADGIGEAMCIGRGRGRHGFGAFGGGFFGGHGFGSGDFRMGRKLASGELQLVLLALLAEQPSHGYELIKALEERSGGFYAPSPGMVYPALTWLEEVGYASVAAEGAKKLYSVTDTGRKYLEEHREAPANRRELFFGQGNDRLAEDADIALVGLRQPVDVPDRHALSGPGRPEDADDLPAADVQVHARQDFLAAVAHLQRFGLP